MEDILILIFPIDYNLRITGGDDSGKLEFQRFDGGSWSGVCLGGFSDAAGDVACEQLNLGSSSDVYSYTSE